MRAAFAVVLALHGLIHLAGFLKAFGFAQLPQLVLPIPRVLGVLWLTAAGLLLAATVVLFAAPRWFWLLGALGVVASQLAIVSSWQDAKFGTLANVLVLAVVVYGAAAWGPFGLREEYAARVASGLARFTQAAPLPPLPPLPLITEAELAPLPTLVQRYLLYVGVVGQPHVSGFQVRFTGRIRGGPEKSWMSFRGEQHSLMQPPTRLFWMQATMFGLPVEALHTYDEKGARMRVRLLSLVPLVDARGPDFTRTETVTLFNDMCIPAPATLVDPAIGWKELDAHSVEATYSPDPNGIGGIRAIRAVLIFDDTGALVNFRSDDRPALAPDGVTFLPQQWSTPVGDYRAQGALRLASRGEARYATPTGEYAYIQFDSLEVSYDLGPK